MIWWRAALALVVALALQVGVNYANDYSDGVRGTDKDRKGPLRLTATGTATPRRGASAAAFLASASPRSSASCSRSSSNPWLLLVGVAAIAAAVLYTGGPKPVRLPRARRGDGARVLRLRRDGRARRTCRSKQVPAAAWWGSLVVGLLACAILLANNVRDVPTDTVSGKRTLAVRIGATARAAAVRRLLRRLVRRRGRDRHRHTRGRSSACSRSRSRSRRCAWCCTAPIRRRWSRRSCDVGSSSWSRCS